MQPANPGRRSHPERLTGSACSGGLGVPVGRVYGVLRERRLIRSATEARKLDEARRRAAKGWEAEPAAPSGVGGRAWAWPADLAAAVVERYAAGESGEAIAEDLGRGQSRVYAPVRERGLLRTLSEASALREERRRRPGCVHCEPELVPAEVAAQVVDICHV
jgi:hypothetical protein